MEIRFTSPRVALGGYLTRFLTRCFAFFCAAVWVGSSPANAADPVEINVMVSQTGSLAFYGGKQAEAFRAIEMYANANGGVGAARSSSSSTTISRIRRRPYNLRTNYRAEGPGHRWAGTDIRLRCNNAVTRAERPGRPVLFAGDHASSERLRVPRRTAYRRRAIGHVTLLQESRSEKLAIITATDASGQTFDQKLDVTLTHKEFQDLAIVAHEHF